MFHRFKPKITVLFLSITILLLSHPIRVYAAQEAPELEIGEFIEILDQEGRLISKIARQAAVGDEIITCDGEYYRVNRVRENRAEATYLGKDQDYLAWCTYFDKAAIQVSTSEWAQRPVGIYHTHSAESYLPSDGHSFIPFKGGIYQVGEQFSKSVQNLGIKISYDRTPHDPHDNMAYVRSRRTAVNLIKKQPAALFDVHRDGIPDPEFYRDHISGKEVSRLRLVIGRENPKYSANLDFAKRLMAYANKKHPKVVKEIFIGRGNYNQDLLSTALLIEAGTYTNYKDKAMDGVSFLAEAVPVVLGLTGDDRDRGVTGTESESSHWWVIILLVLVVTLGAGAFVLLNSENSPEIIDNFRKQAAAVYDRIKRK